MIAHDRSFPDSLDTCLRYAISGDDAGANDLALERLFYGPCSKLAAFIDKHFIFSSFEA